MERRIEEYTERHKSDFNIQVKLSQRIIGVETTGGLFRPHISPRGLGQPYQEINSCQYVFPTCSLRMCVCLPPCICPFQYVLPCPFLCDSVCSAVTLYVSLGVSIHDSLHVCLRLPFCIYLYVPPSYFPRMSNSMPLYLSLSMSLGMRLYVRSSASLSIRPVMSVPF